MPYLFKVEKRCIQYYYAQYYPRKEISMLIPVYDWIAIKLY